MDESVKFDPEAAYSQQQYVLLVDALESARNGGLVDSKLEFYGALALHRLGRNEDAISGLRTAAADPAFGFWSPFWIAQISEQTGDLGAAAVAFHEASQAAESQEASEGVVRCALGALAEAETAADMRRSLAQLLRGEWAHQKASAASLQLAGVVADLVSSVDELRRDMGVVEERLRDWDGGLTRERWPEPLRLETAHVVAYDSADHIAPHGTAVDNSRHPRFVRACERIFDRKLAALDLGCSGGGLVRDFLIRGHVAMGLEGSDYSLKAQRAEWRNLEGWLRTCDITKPFQIETTGGSKAKFDVISAWEVLEHLHREDLPTFFNNVRDHLAPDGLFVASVALTEDVDPVTGAVWHVTLEPREWWEGQMAECGLKTIDTPFEVADYVRGAGTVRFDWDVRKNPEMGFHVVAQLA